MVSDTPSKSRVYKSAGRDPSENLALEEYLMSEVKPDDSILFLYENDPSVIVGRFQNPWKECRTGLAARNRIAVRRRISGGGTVVHGPGNLNFSIMTGRRMPDKEHNLNRIISALRRAGLEILRNSRFDLLIRKSDRSDSDLFKVSGSAFRQTAGFSLHHGTLLVDADLQGVRELLHNPPRDMNVRGVASKPSPVANLADLAPGISVADVTLLISQEWGAASGPEMIHPDDFRTEGAYSEAYDRLISENWIWEKTPPFTERFSGLPGLDGVHLEVDVTGGRISDIRIPGVRSGSLSSAAERLVGCSYQGSRILESAGSAPPDWVKSISSIVDGDGTDGISLL